MKVHIFKIDRPSRREYDSLVDVYRKRLSAASFSETFFSSRSGAQKTQEKVLQQISRLGGSYLITCDERGRQHTSCGLAKKVKTWGEDPQIKNLIFLIGGPYGLPDGLKSAAKECLALGSGVYPSDLAWLILWEQLYRANAINSGSSYHHA